MIFSDVVRHVRNELCFSQADLAKELGVTEQTVRRWEHGASLPQYAAKRKFYAFCEKKKRGTSVPLMHFQLKPVQINRLRSSCSPRQPQ